MPTATAVPSDVRLVLAVVESVPIAIELVPAPVATLPMAIDPTPDAMDCVPVAVAPLLLAVAPLPVAVDPTPVACAPAPTAVELIDAVACAPHASESIAPLVLEPPVVSPASATPLLLVSSRHEVAEAGVLRPIVMATASAPAEAANHREAAGDFNVVDMAFPFYEPGGVTC